MKNILIYGDSNTWGSDSAFQRIAFEKQWPNILQKKLGENYHVVQEGLGGRLAGNLEEKPYSHMNGQVHFLPILKSAAPIDLLIVALGTNDIRDEFNQKPDDLVKNLLWYDKTTAEMAKEDGFKTTALFILPPNYNTNSRFPRDENLRIAVNQQMKSKVKNYLEINDLELTDDGVHFSEQDHQRMANEVEKKVKEILG